MMEEQKTIIRDLIIQNNELQRADVTVDKIMRYLKVINISVNIEDDLDNGKIIIHLV